jgi:hypothetical protein
MVCAVALASCGEDLAPPPPASPPPSSLGSEDPVRQHIRSLGVRDQDVEDRGDHYVVEGDVRFDKGPDFGVLSGLQQRWGGVRVGELEVINVLVDSSIPTSGPDDWRPALALAVADWTNILGSSLRFRVVTTNPDITIMAGTLGAGTLALATAPNASNGRPGHTITIDLNWSDNTNLSDSQKRRNLVHELGHCIGLMHTQDTTAILVPGTPMTDSASVMTPNPGTPWAGFSPNDLLAARTLFPESMAVASWGAGRLDVFTLANDRTVRQLWYDGTYHWQNLGNGFPAGQGFTGSLTATSWGPNRIDVFGLGEDGNVKQLWWDGSGSWGWTNLGNGFGANAGFAGQITATSWGPHRLDVFGMGLDGNVKHLEFDGSGLWAWKTVPQQFPAGQRFTGQLAATAWGTNRIDVFGFGQDGGLRQIWWNGTTWQGTTLGNPFGSSPLAGQLAATSWGANRIDVFGVGVDGNIKQVTWNGGWSSTHLGNGFPGGAMFAGPIAATSWKGADRIDVFGLRGGATGGDVLQLTYPPGTWEWINRGNSW